MLATPGSFCRRWISWPWINGHGQFLAPGHLATLRRGVGVVRSRGESFFFVPHRLGVGWIFLWGRYLDGFRVFFGV